MVIQKIGGWISVGVGLLFIILLPFMSDYMPEKFANSFVIIGILLVALGIFLLQL